MRPRHVLSALVTVVGLVVTAAGGCVPGNSGASAACAAMCGGVADCGVTTCLAYCAGVEGACTAASQTRALAAWEDCAPDLVCAGSGYVSTNCEGKRQALASCGSVNLTDGGHFGQDSGGHSPDATSPTKDAGKDARGQDVAIDFDTGDWRDDSGLGFDASMMCTGNACTTLTDCCGGTLGVDCQGGICCAESGAECLDKAICCGGLPCTDGLCCVGPGASCSVNSDCCPVGIELAYSCDNGKCCIETRGSCGSGDVCCGGLPCTSGSCCLSTGSSCDPTTTFYNCCSGTCSEQGECG